MRHSSVDSTLCDMARVVLLLLFSLLAGGARAFSPVRFSSSFSMASVRNTHAIGVAPVTLLQLAKKAPPPAPAPVEAKGGIEPKYLAALAVFFAAAVFDFFRMHGGVAIWDAGYIP